MTPPHRDPELAPATAVDDDRRGDGDTDAVLRRAPF